MYLNTTYNFNAQPAGCTSTQGSTGLDGGPMDVWYVVPLGLRGRWVVLTPLLVVLRPMRCRASRYICRRVRRRQVFLSSKETHWIILSSTSEVSAIGVWNNPFSMALKFAHHKFRKSSNGWDRLKRTFRRRFPIRTYWMNEGRKWMVRLELVLPSDPEVESPQWAYFIYPATYYFSATTRYVRIDSSRRKALYFWSLLSNSYRKAASDSFAR